MAIRQREKTHFACHQPVQKLSHQGDGFVVTLANHQTITARHVILAAAGGNQAILANSPLAVDFVTPRRGKTLPVSTCAIATTPIPDAILAELSVWERQRLSLPCHTEQEPSDWFIRLQNGVLIYGCAAYIPDGWFQPDVDYILGRIKLFLPGIYQAIQAGKIDITCFWDGVQHFTTRGIPLIQAAAFGQNRLVVAGAFTGVGNIPAQAAGIIAARIVEQQIDSRHFAPDITTAQPPFLGWRLGIDRALHGTGLALVQLLPGGGRLVAAYRAFYHHPTRWGGLCRAIAEIFRP